jgi:hypothetical protein
MKKPKAPPDDPHGWLPMEHVYRSWIYRDWVATERAKGRAAFGLTRAAWEAEQPVFQYLSIEQLEEYLDAMHAAKRARESQRPAGRLR